MAARRPARTYAGGQVATGTTRTDTLYIGRAQLFRFALTADAAGVPPGTKLQMTITDAADNEVFSVTAAAGVTVTGPALVLRPGEYRIRYTVTAPPGTPAPPLIFRLRGNRISDPSGPVANDLAYLPEYHDPNNPNQYLYLPNYVSAGPFFFLFGPG